MNKKYQVKSIAELNNKDHYILNADIETYNSTGKILIKKGKLVKFLNFVGNHGEVLFVDHDGNIEICHVSRLDRFSQTMIGELVTIPGGIKLNTHDGEWKFEGTFKVETIFMAKNNEGVEVEKCFIRFVREDGISTSVTGTIEVSLIQKI